MLEAREKSKKYSENKKGAVFSRTSFEIVAPNRVHENRAPPKEKEKSQSF